MNRFSLSAIAAALAAALLIPASARAAADPEALRVCLAEDNAPFSSSRAGGIDPALLDALSARLHRPLLVEWVQVPNRGGLGKALRLAFEQSRCDLFAGVPLDGETGQSLAERHLIASRVYLTVGYVLLQAPGRHLAPGELKRARLGAVTATPADLYLFRAGLERQPYGNNPALVQAVSRGEVDAAIVWGPALARLQAQGEALWPDAIVRQMRFDADMLAHLALVAREGREALIAELNEALTGLEADGVLAAIGAQHGLPMTDAGRQQEQL
jgi:ABC-type amino acid transport substrate-binding protein